MNQITRPDDIQSSIARPPQEGLRLPRRHVVRPLEALIPYPQWVAWKPQKQWGRIAKIPFADSDDVNGRFRRDVNKVGA